MSTRFSRTVLLSVVLALTLFSGVALAGHGPRFLTATGQEATVNVIDPGTAICIGGEATGDPYNPCVGSHRIILKRQVVEAAVLTVTGEAGPMLAGTDTLTVDCNLDGNLAGNCWGIFEWQVSEDSLWAGTLNGSFDFSTFTFTYRMVGRGFGGAVDGMQLQYDVYYDGGYDFIGDFVARVHTRRNRRGV